MNRNRNKLLGFNIVVAILECVFAIYWFGIMEGWWQQNKPTGTFEMLLGSYLIHSLFKNFCIFLAVSAVTNIISIACKFKWGYLISIVCFVFSYNQLPSVFPATEPSILPLWIFILCNIISFFVELFSKNEKKDEEQKIVTSLPSKDYTYSGPTLTLETALSRGFIALEDKEWNKADYFFEYALNLNATCSDAYLGKLLIELNVSKLDSLAETDILFENNNNYKRALQFGSSDFIEKLKDLCVKCKSHNYENYIKSFENASTKYDYEILVNKFEKLNGFELSNKYTDDCRSKIDELEKKFNNNLRIVLSIILVFIILSLLYFYYFKPNKQYNIANKLASEKKYNEALCIYDELGDYKDSKEKYHKYFIEKCKELIINKIQQKEYELAIEESKKNNVDLLEFTKDLIYEEGKIAFDNKKYDEAKEIFKYILTYKDSRDNYDKCFNEKSKEIIINLFQQKEYELAIEESRKNNADLLEFTEDLIYREGKAVFDNKEYEEAREIFKHILTYKDSKNFFQECKDIPLFEKATQFYSEKKFKEAIALFDDFENKKKIYDLFINDMVLCPVGRFIMGSPKNELGRNNVEDSWDSLAETQHVEIISKPFYIGKYEVTQILYKKIMGNNPSVIIKGDNYPVNLVDWDKAEEFCGKLNFMFKDYLPQGYKFDLPTEAQWEYACRAGTTTSLNSGKNITSKRGFCPNLDEVGWYSENSKGVTHPVGQKKPNAWGIYDMHGNIQELTNNYSPSNALIDKTEGFTDEYSVIIRGGGIGSDISSSYAESCRSASRDIYDPDGHVFYPPGFRLALIPINPNFFEIKSYEDFMKDMVKCPAGTFTMGSPENELGRNIDESQHKVTISKPFYIGKYEVTQSLYEKIMNNNPSESKGDNHPVTSVTWFEAKEFCEKLNDLFKDNLPKGYKFDLPTEAQWEYACRAGTTTSLNSGKNITREKGHCSYLNEVGWYSYRYSHLVGMKKTNAWGIYDMHGNVLEWCNDWYGDYPKKQVTDPIGGKSGSKRILRSGSEISNFSPFSPDNNTIFRSANRYCNYPSHKSNEIGFRVALVPVL